MKLTRQETLAKLRTILEFQLGVNPEQVTETATFENLGADSLDFVEIIMAIEEEFGIDINDDEAEKIQTVAQAIDHIERELA